MVACKSEGLGNNRRCQCAPSRSSLICTWIFEGESTFQNAPAGRNTFMDSRGPHELESSRKARPQPFAPVSQVGSSREQPSSRSPVRISAGHRTRATVTRSGERARQRHVVAVPRRAATANGVAGTPTSSKLPSPALVAARPSFGPSWSPFAQTVYGTPRHVVPCRRSWIRSSVRRHGCQTLRLLETCENRL